MFLSELVDGKRWKQAMHCSVMEDFLDCANKLTFLIYKNTSISTVILHFEKTFTARTKYTSFKEEKWVKMSMTLKGRSAGDRLTMR